VLNIAINLVQRRLIRVCLFYCISHTQKESAFRSMDVAVQKFNYQVHSSAEFASLCKK